MLSSDDGYGSKPATPQRQPPTPSLVFTAQFAGSQTLPDFSGSSPYVEPLQLVNYSAMVEDASGSRRDSGVMASAPLSPIQVIRRTKGSRHSPIMTPVRGETLIELDGESLPGGMKNPYGFTYSGRSTPLGPSSSHTFSPPPPPPLQLQLTTAHHTAARPASALDPNFELPHEAVHRTLIGQCRFIPFPATLHSPKSSNHSHSNSGGGNTTGAEAGAESMAVFIGQVRFETTPAELLWLVRRTCGAVASHLESRGAGCYLLHCRSEADLQLVRGLHKRILFDIGGVWIARTAEEIDLLCEYVATDAALLSRKARLPRDSMVVEDLKVDSNTGASRYGSGGGKHYAVHSGHYHHHHHSHHNNSNHSNRGQGHHNNQRQQRRHYQTPEHGPPGVAREGAMFVPNDVPQPPPYNY